MLASVPQVRVAGKPPSSLRDVDADVALFAQAAGVPQQSAVEVLVYLRSLIHNWIHGAPVQRSLFEALDDCNSQSPLVHIANWIDDIPAVYFLLDEAIVDESGRLVPDPAIPDCLVSLASAVDEVETAVAAATMGRSDTVQMKRGCAVPCLGPSKQARNRVPAPQAIVRALRHDGRTASRNGKQGLERGLTPHDRPAQKSARSRKTAVVTS